MKEKNKHIFLKKVLIFMFVAIIFLTILGFLFPGLIWTKNLGINYSKKDYKSVIDKFNNENIQTIELTSEELTALLNEKLDFCEIKNTQVKINDNDTIAISANANLDCGLNNISNGYTAGQIKSFASELAILPSNVNFYINFSGSIIDNKCYIHFKSIYIQGIELSNNLINSNEANTMLTNSLNEMITDYNTTNSTNFNKISVDNNKIKIEGMIPSIKY